MAPRDKLLAEWFWIDRWDGSSATLLPMEARGLYREMLTQAWRRGAWLPNDHEAIRRAVRATPGEWRRCWPTVSSYWRVDGDRLINDTQVEIYTAAKAAADRASERGLRGAQAKHGHRPSGAQARAQAQPEHKPPSPSPSPSTTATTPPTPPEGGVVAADQERALLGVRCPRCQHDLLRENGRFTDGVTAGKGWICWKKTGGCGQSYVREDPRVAIQLTDRASAAIAEEIRLEEAAQAESAAAAAAREEERAALEAAEPEPEPAARDLWTRVLGHLEGSLDRHIFGTWFTPTRGMRLDGEELVVRVPNERFLAWIAGNYRAPLDAAMKAAGANGLRLLLQTPHTPLEPSQPRRTR